MCPTPVGMASESEASGTKRHTLKIAVAGTTCTDVSPIGICSELWNLKCVKQAEQKLKHISMHGLFMN